MNNRRKTLSKTADQAAELKKLSEAVRQKEPKALDLAAFRQKQRSIVNAMLCCMI